MLFSQSVSSASMMRCCLGTLATATELAKELVCIEPEAQVRDLVVLNLEDFAKLERSPVARGPEAAVAARIEISRVRAGRHVVDLVNGAAPLLHVFHLDVPVGKGAHRRID